MQFYDRFALNTGASNVAADYVEPPWRRASEHMGPTHPTPLKDALANLHTSGLLLLMAHAMTWFNEQVGRKHEGADLRHLIEAVYAFTCDPALVTMKPSLRRFPVDTGEATTGAAKGFRWIFARVYLGRKGKRPIYPPVTSTAQAAYLARHFFSEPKEFDRGYERAMATVRSLADFPDPRTSAFPQSASPEEREAEALRSFGPFMPPSTTDPTPADLKAVAGYLAEMDRLSNPYLRPLSDEVLAEVSPSLRAELQ